MALVEKEAQRITKERNAFRADQFKLDGTVNAHKFHTAIEIWEQTGGNIDAFVDILGSGGTFMGCAEKLKELKKINLPKIPLFPINPLCYTCKKC